MKQVLQSMRSGKIGVVDLPFPQLRGPGVLVRTAASLISPGTERAALQFAKGSLLDKARSRPDLVRQMLDKIRREGLIVSARTAFERLDKPVAPGYACAGIVLATGPGVGEFAPGDRVACAGAGFATHAEVNYVPRNLVVQIPGGRGREVGFDEAAFSTLGAIALHGVRLAKPQLGDRAVVIGLGVLGLLAVQILKAHGCRVAAVDLNLSRCEVARALGAEIALPPGDIPAAVRSWTEGYGADFVVVAAASEGNEPAVLAADLARLKGRIVAVGATGMDIPRRMLFEKELSLVVSRSYGPGRYDPEYEERGRDYPRAYVRWTERENMRAFLDLIASGAVDVCRLISHRFTIDDAERAYQALDTQSVLGMVLEYPVSPGAREPVGTVSVARGAAQRPVSGTAWVSFVGAGNFARGVLLPAFRKQGRAALSGVVASTGLSAKSAADKFQFKWCSTSAADVWADNTSNAVVIATRHDAHASLVCEAIAAGKAVFVEKPLCLNIDELDSILESVYAAASQGGNPFLMVGFNRRFAPATRMMKAHFDRVAGPVTVTYRVNAGRLPSTSWVVSAEEGGGRILGEVCHFIDFAAFVANAPIAQVFAVRGTADVEEVIVTLRMTNGSLGSIAYLVDGDPSAPKERIEISGGGASGVIEDFRTASLRVGGKISTHGWRFAQQDKGHTSEVAAFVDAVAHGHPSPIKVASSVNSTRATFAVLESLEVGSPIDIEP